MSFPEIERAFVRLCCDSTLPAPSETLDAEHIKIWGVYRNMVRHRFLDETKNGLRRTLKVVGDDVFAATFSRFMAEAPPRSRFFYDIVPEFARFAAPLWQVDDSVSPWAFDLVRYEATRYRMSDVVAHRDQPIVDFDFDRVPVLHEAFEILSCTYRVHRDPEADASYLKQPVEICVYRGADDRGVGSYVLSPFAADCMRAWQAGVTVSESVRNVTQARAIAPDAQLIDALCTVLSDLMERGLVMGSRPT